MMEEFAWSSEWILGVPSMDASHKALLEKFNAASNAPDGEFGLILSTLIRAVEDDFREEEEIMERIDFPALRSHREQHARVLAALHEVVPEAMAGNYDAARHAISLWPKWFQFHLWTMDAALAIALDTANYTEASAPRDT